MRPIHTTVELSRVLLVPEDVTARFDIVYGHRLAPWRKDGQAASVDTRVDSWLPEDVRRDTTGAPNCILDVEHDAWSTPEAQRLRVRSIEVLRRRFPGVRIGWWGYVFCELGARGPDHRSDAARGFLDSADWIMPAIYPWDELREADMYEWSRGMVAEAQRVACGRPVYPCLPVQRDDGRWLTRTEFGELLDPIASAGLEPVLWAHPQNAVGVEAGYSHRQQFRVAVQAWRACCGARPKQLRVPRASGPAGGPTGGAATGAGA